jgi:hypothetical protein
MAAAWASRRGTCGLSLQFEPIVRYMWKRKIREGDGMKTQPIDPAATAEVGHALDMLAQLPTYIDKPALPLVVRTACLESYFSNLRLMFEFLVGRRDVRHIHRHDFLPDWEPEVNEKLETLRRQYGFASEQVSHLAKSRISSTGPSTVLQPIAIFMITLIVFDVMQEFVAALARADNPNAVIFDRLVNDAERKFNWPDKAYRPEA